MAGNGPRSSLARERYGQRPRGETRHLGIHFKLDLKWAKQRQKLANKFKGLHDRITSTKSTQEQAVYCANAVINAAMRYPL